MGTESMFRVLEEPDVELVSKSKSKNKYKCAITYREWNQLVQRVWSVHLSLPERAIINMIFDRTIGWGKKREWISLEQFMDGVFNKERTIRHSPGTGLSNRCVLDCLERLTKTGCVHVEKNFGRTSCYTLNLKWKPKMFKIPKKKKALKVLKIGKLNHLPVNYVHSPVNDVHTTCELRSHKEDIILRRYNTKEDLKGREDATPALAIEKIRIRYREKKATDIQSFLESSNLKLSQIALLWEHGFKEHFPDALYSPPKKKELFAITQYSRRYGKGNNKVPFGTYLDWCIRYWKRLAGTEFIWMNNPPQFPNMGVFVKFSDKFEDAFSMRKELEATLALSSRERMIKSHTDRGTPYDTAAEEVDQQLLVTRQLEEIKTLQRQVHDERIRLYNERNSFRKPDFILHPGVKDEIGYTEEEI